MSEAPESWGGGSGRPRNAPAICAPQAVRVAWVVLAGGASILPALREERWESLLVGLGALAGWGLAERGRRIAGGALLAGIVSGSWMLGAGVDLTAATRALPPALGLALAAALLVAPARALPRAGAALLLALGLAPAGASGVALALAGAEAAATRLGAVALLGAAAWSVASAVPGAHPPASPARETAAATPRSAAPSSFDPALLEPLRQAIHETRATHVSDGSPLRVALDAPHPWRAQVAASLSHNVQLVARDAEAELAMVLLPAEAAPDGWQRALPPAEVVASAPNPADAAAVTDAPAFDTAYLWRRRLPPESLVRAARPHLPAQMGLRGLHAPALALAHAGSPAVARVEGRLVALFVRAQALWRAESADDGATWSTPAPLGIEAVDPALVAPERPGAPWRLFAVTFPRRDADPVAQDTEIRSWTSPDLRTFTPEPGVRLAGRGLLDPSVARTAEGWEMWLTAQGTALARATSTDGRAFTRAGPPALTGLTVPEVSADGRELLVQARVGDRTGVYVLARADALAAPSLGPGVWTNPARPLEGCGTGATFVRGEALAAGAHPQVWVSDHAGACGPPYAWPEAATPR